MIILDSKPIIRRLSANRFRFWSKFTRAMVTGILAVSAAGLAPAFAQSFGGRAATVAVAEAGEDVLAFFTDVQGRVAAGQSTSITASTNSIFEMVDLKLGDRIKAGTAVAVQDATDLKHRLALLREQDTEARLKLAQADQGIADDKILVGLLESQIQLLEGKAQRAETLASRNAITIDVVETSRNAVINARQQYAARRAALSNKGYQRQLAEASLSRIALEIEQTKRDIAATKIVAPTDGQIIFITPAQRGYSREGDVLVRTRGKDAYEVEAEIPLEYLRFVAMAKNIDALDYSGTAIRLKTRQFLPVQNVRTGTQSVRFVVAGDMPPSLLAENAPIILKIPTTSPAPVVTVPKDAVIPVSGGHVLFVAEDGVAVQKRIRLGNAAGDNFVVLSGINPGELVITRGNEGLVDGKKIKIGDPALRPKGPEGEKWTLNWTTRRGPASGDLLLGKEKSLFNDEEVEVVRAGNDINFIGKLVLPFGVLDLEFSGTIDGDNMAGGLVMRGLPGGREAEMEFTGTRDSK